jgi:transposase
MGGKRRRYDRQFKIEAVRLVTQRGKRATEVARDLGVHVNLIYNWKRELAEDPDFAFPGHGKLKPADDELRRLKRELEDVKEERDILKKALAIFSKRPK